MNEIPVVILCGGQGTRMRSDLPKVLQPLAGKPLLAHVLATARELRAEDVCVVYGHGGEKVPETIGDDSLRWALQAEQLGTGHAVQQAMPETPDNNRVLILFGDVPLLTAGTLSRLLEQTGSDELAILSVDMDDPTGYGRILRDGDAVTGIVEQKDASEAEQAIQEINTGVMVAPANKLRKWLDNLGNDNAQGEYYLTDTLEILRAPRRRVDGGRRRLCRPGACRHSRQAGVRQRRIHRRQCRVRGRRLPGRRRKDRIE